MSFGRNGSNIVSLRRSFSKVKKAQKLKETLKLKQLEKEELKRELRKHEQKELKAKGDSELERWAL